MSKVNIKCAACGQGDSAALGTVFIYPRGNYHESCYPKAAKESSS